MRFRSNLWSGQRKTVSADSLFVIVLNANRRYDINCACEDGTRCNVEMTLHPLSCEAVRIEYYADKGHVGQESKGKRYDDLVQTYHVSLLNT